METTTFTQEQLQSTLNNITAERKLPSQGDIYTILNQARLVLEKEPNVVEVAAPVVIVGNIHGQFEDLLQIFASNGQVKDKKYLFLGNYVDRGQNSLETFLTLLLLKILYPAHITLLRGNHECVEVCKVYGFKDEIIKKLGSEEPLERFSQVFNTLPLAATLNGGKTLAVHGGISPLLHTVKQITEVDRFKEVEKEGLVCDLLWSDPDVDIQNHQPSGRGAGVQFGETLFNKFLETSGVTKLIRSHQLVNEGYSQLYGNKLITVYSAANYCGTCQNLGSVVEIQADQTEKFHTYQSAVPVNPAL